MSKSESFRMAGAEFGMAVAAAAALERSRPDLDFGPLNAEVERPIREATAIIMRFVLAHERG